MEKKKQNYNIAALIPRQSGGVTIFSSNFGMTTSSSKLGRPRSSIVSSEIVRGRL